MRCCCLAEQCILQYLALGPDSEDGVRYLIWGKLTGFAGSGLSSWEKVIFGAAQHCVSFKMTRRYEDHQTDTRLTNYTIDTALQSGE